MILNFSELKKTRDSGLAKLTEKLNQMATPTYEEDTRFWQPTVDKAKNGYAVIRFLPAVSGEEIPFVRVWSHGFQGPSGWYIEDSLTTIGKPDPVSDYNSKLWAQGEKSAGRTFVTGTPDRQGSKRKLNFISNIYVVEDSAKPENNGKVFLFKYGKKIYDHINGAANPEFPDREPFDPFDFWKGANFKLKIRQVEGYRNYDQSEFDLIDGPDGKKIPRGPLSSDDEKLEAIWKSEYPLFSFVDPNSFKSYNDLKAKLDRVMGNSTNEVEQESRVIAQPKLPEREEASIIPQAEDEEEMSFFRDMLKK